MNDKIFHCLLWFPQEQHYRNQTSAHEAALREMEQSSTHLAETVAKLEAADESRRAAEKETHALNLKFIQAKVIF